MKRLLPFLLLSLLTPSLHSQTSSQQFTEPFLRQLLNQLYELEGSRAQNISYADFVKREQALHEQEKLNWQKTIDLTQQQVDLKQRELDLEKEKSAMYKSLYDAAKKKKAGFGCWMGRIFTLGIHRCG